MRYYNYIWFILILAGLSFNSPAQYITIVCPGDTGSILKVKGSEGSTFVWTVKGGTITQNYNDSVKVNWGNNSGEFEITVQEFSKHNCPAIPVSGLVLVSAPVFNLGADLDLCQGDSITILAPDNYYSYLWHDGSTGLSYTAHTQEKVILEVTDEYGCKRSDDLYVTLRPLPVINLADEAVICGNESLVLDAGGDGVFFKWSTGENTREITVYEGKKTIWVIVKDAYDCENSDTIQILACSSNIYFKDMPTAFTPNDDGVNDVWRIPQLQTFPESVVEIFDRWGNLLFRSEPGYPNPWDGTYKGKRMPMDSYYFVIILNSDGMDPITGTVTLIR